MNTLKEIIGILKIIGVSVAGVTFVILLLKMTIEPEQKQKYINLSKNLVIATVLITLALSLTEIPKHYFGSTIKITDDQLAEMTFEKIKDKDCQGRETVEIGHKWYVVTDENEKISSLKDESILKPTSLYSTDKIIEDVDYLRPFSECQGLWKGYFADIIYYRDSDGIIFPATFTYAEYKQYKETGGGGFR